MSDIDKNDPVQDGVQDNLNEPLDEESEALEALVGAPPARVKRGVGWGVVLPLFLLAGVGGAVGGWALTQYVMPNYIALPQSAPAAYSDSGASNIDLGPLTARLEAAEKKLSTQSSQLSLLSSEMKSGTASVKVGEGNEPFDVLPLLSRIDALEAQLQTSVSLAISGLPAISNTASNPVPVFDENGEPVAAADYLKIYENRLVTLEKSFAEVQALAETSGPVLEASLDGETDAAREAAHESFRNDLEAMRARVSQLETDITEAQSMAAAPTIVRETVLLPQFPREALLSAMTAPRDAESQGWLNRTLKKHISVRNPQDVARANATLDEIETLAAARNYTAALKLIEAMPSDVRSLAGEWTNAVKAETETP